MSPAPDNVERRRSPKREKPQQVADELRRLIIAGELDEGDSLGHEPDLIERFGVSRPSLREALRILETEGLITVVRGVQGGVVVHRPDRRQAARTAALILQTRNVPLADVFEARTILEPIAVRMVAEARNRVSSAKRLRALIADEIEAIDDAEEFGRANAQFHEELVSMGGNQTLGIMAEMLDEVVARAITVLASGGADESKATRQRGVRSQERLVELIEAGDAEGAEEHWRKHMTVVGRVMLGQQAKTVIDLLDHL